MQVGTFVEMMNRKMQCCVGYRDTKKPWELRNNLWKEVIGYLITSPIELTIVILLKQPFKVQHSVNFVNDLHHPIIVNQHFPGAAWTYSYLEQRYPYRSQLADSIPTSKTMTEIQGKNLKPLGVSIHGGRPGDCMCLWKWYRGWTATD